MDDDIDTILARYGLRWSPGCALRSRVIRQLIDPENCLDLAEFIREVLAKSLAVRRYLLGFDFEADVLLRAAPTLAKLRRISATAFADSVCKLAKFHRHAIVNEMHFLLAAVLMSPKDADQVFGPLAEACRRQYPAGKPSERKFLNAVAAKDSADASLVEQWIAETRFAVPRVQLRLERYLSSPFYPFDTVQHARFLREHVNYPKQRSTAHVAFMCHGTSSDCDAQAED